MVFREGGDLNNEARIFRIYHKQKKKDLEYIFDKSYDYEIPTRTSYDSLYKVHLTGVELCEKVDKFFKAELKAKTEEFKYGPLSRANRERERVETLHYDFNDTVGRDLDILKLIEATNKLYKELHDWLKKMDAFLDPQMSGDYLLTNKERQELRAETKAMRDRLRAERKNKDPKKKKETREEITLRRAEATAERRKKRLEEMREMRSQGKKNMHAVVERSIEEGSNLRSRIQNRRKNAMAEYERKRQAAGLSGNGFAVDGQTKAERAAKHQSRLDELRAQREAQRAAIRNKSRSEKAPSPKYNNTPNTQSPPKNDAMTAVRSMMKASANMSPEEKAKARAAAMEAFKAQRRAQRAAARSRKGRT
eukprot:CAMPEP_0167746198 /NCGR_PEP_ID=MMETSP0110_2-20121227/3580_1 /TAXON_ID=629695 /ORGANISM="Gymnochlora sp., Strain CCMP2014" /LENGTH=363 /DNA_ID=CAMNT_0007630937 /DNA_START=147 /DNA_END=1238 /DNA_ORIENTATION=+